MSVITKPATPETKTAVCDRCGVSVAYGDGRWTHLMASTGEPKALDPDDMGIACGQKMEDVDLCEGCTLYVIQRVAKDRPMFGFADSAMVILRAAYIAVGGDDPVDVSWLSDETTPTKFFAACSARIREALANPPKNLESSFADAATVYRTAIDEILGHGFDLPATRQTGEDYRRGYEAGLSSCKRIAKEAERWVNEKKTGVPTY